MRAMRVVVIGGGAAGFFGSIACAERYPHTEVILLEAARQTLNKVSISGGGRCNVTHACFEPDALIQNYPRGGKALRGAFSRWQPRDMVQWLAQRDVQLKTEADGRMFPVTDDSATIVDCLTWAAKRSRVLVRTGISVGSVTRLLRESGESKFEIKLKSGESIWFDRLLLATGSNPQGYEIARSLGHQIEPPVPSLFTFNILDRSLHALAGVSVESAKLQLITDPPQKLEQTGAVLITHWGLSGPAVLKLSAWGARVLHSHRYQAKLRINWLPQSKIEAIGTALIAAKAQVPKRLILNHCPVNLPNRLWEYLVARAGIELDKRWADLSNKSIEGLIKELAQGEYSIEGKSAFKEEFVTCGGVNLKQVDFKTMESRCCPGLFFAGEILDIDGVTGGFNFQSAWTTAWLAGQSIGNA